MYVCLFVCTVLNSRHSAIVDHIKTAETKKTGSVCTIADSSLQPSTRFVANVNCPDGTEAGLANSILNVMGKFGVPAKNNHGFGE